MVLKNDEGYEKNTHPNVLQMVKNEISHNIYIRKPSVCLWFNANKKIEDKRYYLQI